MVVYTVNLFFCIKISDNTDIFLGKIIPRVYNITKGTSNNHLGSQCKGGKATAVVMNYYGFTLRRGLVIISLWGLATSAGAYLCRLEHWLPGLLFGYVAGALYYVLMQRQIVRGANLPIEQAMLCMRGSLLSRFALVTAAVLFALQLPQIKIVAVLLGAFSFPLVVFCNTITLIIKEVTGSYSTGR